MKSIQVSTHEVKRSEQSLGNHELIYECLDCGLTGHEVYEFDQHSCDEYRHNPAKKK